MKYLILSDIHSNFPALDRILKKVRRKSFANIVILGDFVGYGSDPNQVVERMRDFNNLIAIRGNHDKVSSGIEDGSNFNMPALEAARWTGEKLTTPNKNFLKSLDKGPVAVNDSFEFAHGSPEDEDKYILTQMHAESAFEAMKNNICFFGHTHIPVVYEKTDEGLAVSRPVNAREEFELKEDRQYLINPGSVGQPRDGDTRAAYAILNTETNKLLMFRIEYDYQKASSRIEDTELPFVFSERINKGK